MWWKAKDEPENEDICLVAVQGSVNLVRDIAWYDIDAKRWENLKGEEVKPVYWCDNELPAIPDEFYNFIE